MFHNNNNIHATRRPLRIKTHCTCKPSHVHRYCVPKETTQRKQRGRTPRFLRRLAVERSETAHHRGSRKALVSEPVRKVFGPAGLYATLIPLCLRNPWQCGVRCGLSGLHAIPAPLFQTALALSGAPALAITKWQIREIPVPCPDTVRTPNPYLQFHPKQIAISCRDPLDVLVPRDIVFMSAMAFQRRFAPEVVLCHRPAPTILLQTAGFTIRTGATPCGFIELREQVHVASVQSWCGEFGYTTLV